MNDSGLLLWSASIGLAVAIIILLIGWCVVFGKSTSGDLDRSIMVVVIADNIRIVTNSEQTLQGIARSLRDASKSDEPEVKRE